MNRCFSCFKEYDGRYGVCPYCGATKATGPIEAIHLSPGTVLANRYVIGTAVGSGGFGIIYKAWDSKLETVVAVKEFFVSRLMTRAAGECDVIVNKKSVEEYKYRKERFLAEARTMAKFGAHRSIPNVFEFFEANRTAYIVMELLMGEGLNAYLKESEGKIDVDFALYIANEVGKALTTLHENGIIHRDVAPDNIYICSDKEIKIKLLDLGAAKLADSTDDVIDIILKPGYSPVEQYDNVKGIGPGTDIYALGATLYVMLTGIKPDESTNRQVDDTVVAPHDLDESIPENLSNAIMKAMAIEKHMRFKSVNDFLKAINGEKKVVTLAKEKKMRKRRRFSGIIAASLAVLLVGGSVFQSYWSRKNAELLEDAAITVWFSVSDNSSEGEAMENIRADFLSKFSNVQIELKAIPEAEYEAEIKEAASKGSLPTLFESTGLSDEVLQSAADLTKVLESTQAKSCLFLSQYKGYYKDNKRIPLGIEVPMAYVVTSGQQAAAYSEATFSSLSDFQGADVALDERVPSLSKNGFTTNHARDEFPGKTAVLISSTMYLNEMRSSLISVEKTGVFYESDKIYCDFVYEWSVGVGEEAEIEAAERLLSWMLGKPYQTILMIGENQEGQIPLNREVFESKITLLRADNELNLQAIGSLYRKFVFEK